jgi:hypothetical protein
MGAMKDPINLREVYVKDHPDALGPIAGEGWTPKVLFKPDRRDVAYQRLMWIYPEYLASFPQSKLIEILYARYDVSEGRLMTCEQLADLYKHFRTVLMSVKGEVK